MRRTRMRDILAPAALLLALACSGAVAHGQSDGYFNAGGGLRGDGDVPMSGGANWGFGYGAAGDGAMWGAYGVAGDGAMWGDLDGAGDGASWGSGYDNGTATPVGSGLLVLAASGACYAALRARRKRDGATD